MPLVSESTLMLLGVATALVVATFFVWELLKEGDAASAAENTSERAVGGVSGALAAGGATLAFGLEVVAREAPELLITVLGVGAIIKGVSWPVFLAVALLGYAVMAGVWGE